MIRLEDSRVDNVFSAAACLLLEVFLLLVEGSCFPSPTECIAVLELECPSALSLIFSILRAAEDFTVVGFTESVTLREGDVGEEYKLVVLFDNGIERVCATEHGTMDTTGEVEDIAMEGLAIICNSFVVETVDVCIMVVGGCLE